MKHDADNAMTCPRRSEGPWFNVSNADHWEANAWSPDGQPIEPVRSVWRSGDPPIGPYEWHRWQWPWQPRTCSYCGGVHPEDAIKLIGEGWENEFSTKAYKGYLNPPGTAQKDATILHRLRKDGDLSVAPSVWSPTPPVKLYTMHFDADQMARLNMAIVGARR